MKRKRAMRGMKGAGFFSDLFEKVSSVVQKVVPVLRGVADGAQIIRQIRGGKKTGSGHRRGRPVGSGRKPKASTRGRKILLVK
jgi:hypothetical protein